MSGRSFPNAAITTNPTNRRIAAATNKRWSVLFGELIQAIESCRCQSSRRVSTRASKQPGQGNDLRLSGTNHKSGRHLAEPVFKRPTQWRLGVLKGGRN